MKRFFVIGLLLLGGILALKIGPAKLVYGQTATPTPSICNPPVDCAAPPVGCNYTGGNSCACGQLVCPATPTSAPVSSCITLPVTDVFSGSTVNTNLWNIWGTNVTVTAGSLNTSVVSGATGHSGLTTVQSVCGDFDVSLNFGGFSSGGQSEGDLILRAQTYATDAGWPSGTEVFIQRYSKIGGQGFWTNTRLSGVFGQGQSASSFTTRGKLRIRRIGSNFYTYYDDGSGSGWQQLGIWPNIFNSPVYITFGVSNADQNPSISANFSNFSLTQAIADPSITLPPPTPTTPVAPTPPSGADKYTIDVGNKQSLVINIGAAVSPLIRFKAKLGSVRATPDLYLRLRVRDEGASVKNPAQSVTDACTNPPPSDRDYYIPVHATGGVYSAVSQNSSTLPTAPGATAATVSADGWVTLDGILPGKYYTIYLKGPMTRKSRMIQHVLLQPGQISAQDFDWSANTLDPGDLPDPNNGGKQDCVTNATDWSLLQSRIGVTDAASLSVCDVNYDGICNAGDSVAILKTLSTKPDDDQ